MNWLYLLSGGMALYSVESADINQPFHITAMVALAVCLLPVTLDTYLTSQRGQALNRRMPEALNAKTGD